MQLQIALLDFQDRAPGIRRLRTSILGSAAPPAGGTAVDVGSGTGAMVAELARLVGESGVAVGVEPDPVLRELAGARLRRPELFVDGVADRLPFADASVDLIYCERVLQHVPQVQAAVDEFARVLRPGGSCLLVDTDHRTLRASGLSAALDRLVAENLPAVMAVHPGVARDIPRYLLGAGLQLDPDVISSALTFVGSQLLEWPVIQPVVARGVTAGALSAAQGEEIMNGVATAVAEGTAFLSMSIFGFMAHKPTEPS